MVAPLMATAGVNTPPEMAPPAVARVGEGKADGRAVKRVVGVVFAGGDVEYDVAQGEGEQQFDDERGDEQVPGQGQGFDLCWVDHPAGQAHREQAADELGDPVSDGVGNADAA